MIRKTGLATLPQHYVPYWVRNIFNMHLLCCQMSSLINYIRFTDIPETKLYFPFHREVGLFLRHVYNLRILNCGYCTPTHLWLIIPSLVWEKPLLQPGCGLIRKARSFIGKSRKYSPRTLLQACLHILAERPYISKNMVLHALRWQKMPPAFTYSISLPLKYFET